MVECEGEFLMEIWKPDMEQEDGRTGFASVDNMV